MSSTPQISADLPPVAARPFLRSLAAKWFVCAALGVLLALFPFQHANLTAVSDAFLQLIMADGLLTHTGYGYFENGDFVPMSSRHPATRWPPGLTAMAAVLSKLGLNPLVVMVRLYPLQLGVLYLLFVLALKNAFGVVAASSFSFSALSTVIVLDSYTRLSCESYTLLATAFILWLVLTGPKGKGRRAIIVAGAALTAACIALTMTRFAGAFLVPAACLLFAALWIRGVSRRLTFLAVTGFSTAAPLIALLWYLGPGPAPEPESNLLRADQAYWAAPPVVWVAREWVGYLATFAEAVVPRVSAVYRYPIVPAALGALVLSSAAIALGTRYRKYYDAPPGDSVKRRVAFVAMGLALAYLLVLSLVSTYFKTSWASVYRVSAFVLPVVVIACASSIYVCLPVRFRGVCVAFFLLVGMIRLGHRWHHQSEVDETTLLNREYRDVVAGAATVLRESFPGAQTLLVQTEGHWDARYLSREAWYAERYDGNFPWKVLTTEKERIWLYTPGQIAKVPASTVIVIHSADYPNLPFDGERIDESRWDTRLYESFVLMRRRQPTSQGGSSE